MKRILTILKQSLSGEERDYTEGNIQKAIILLAIPMVLEMIMEGLFAIVDAYWVSKISVNALATVGLTESVITMVYALAIGLSAAATATVARRVGEKRPDLASRAALQATILAVVVAVLIGVPGFIYSDNILGLMGAEPDLIAECSGYTKIMFGTNIVIMLIFLFNAIFRGAGNATYAMYALWISNGINIVLDPLLIFGWGPFPAMGIEGAAIATVIGRGVGVAFQLVLLLRGVGIVKLVINRIGFHWETMKKILDVAAGGAFQYIIMSASWVFLMRIIAEFGAEAMAGYVTAIRIIIFTFMPLWGLSNAAATLVGQNLGAKKPDRAEKSAWQTAHFSTGVLLTIALVLVTFAPIFLPYFNPEPAVIEAGVLTLRIFCVSYVIYAYGLVFSQAFNGAGDTKTPTVINFICFWLIEIPLGYLLAIRLNWGLAGVCWSVAFAEALMSVVFIWLFRKGTWKTVEI
ncbi:MAG: MATE family efflux transporter [Saprospiraceae bacterium]